MSIREKALLIIGLTVVALVLAINAAAKNYLLARFSELGMQYAREDMQRVEKALENEKAELDTSVWDWSAWDATYTYMQDRRAAYVDENLTVAACVTLRINLLALVDTNGAVAWGRVCDLKAKTFASLPEAFAPFVQPGQPLVGGHSATNTMSGLVLVSGVPMLVCSRPILMSDGNGPARGTLIMGRYLDDDHVARLGELTGVTVHRGPISGAPVAPATEPGNRIGAIAVRECGDHLESFAVVHDLYAKPCLLLRGTHARRLYTAAELAVSWFLILMTVGSLLIGLVGFVVLERNVIRRLTRLCRNVMTMNATGNTSTRLAAKAPDEVGSLAMEFNRLLDMLCSSNAAQKALNEQLEQRVRDRTAELSASQSEIRRLYRHMEAVRETERKRIAEWIHDDVGQALTALKMDVERTRADLQGTGNEAASRLGEVSASIDGLTGTIQDIAMELRPPMLDHFGLATTIEWTVRKFFERSGIRCEVDVEDVGGIDHATSVALYRIVRELLTNVVRHAKASVAFVRLHREGDRLRLEVEDNGHGISEDVINGPMAFGLSEIRERVNGLAGEVTIGRGEDNGTRVCVVVPWTGASTGGSVA